MWQQVIGLCVSDSSFTAPNIGEERGLKGREDCTIGGAETSYIVGFWNPAPVQQARFGPTLLFHPCPNDSAICPDELWKQSFIGLFFCPGVSWNPDGTK